MESEAGTISISIISAIILGVTFWIIHKIKEI